ncbi:hypothetical protein [Dyella caseinilytica]|uniref:DUF3761 domain-containing protein n=1 Tax=Dyella caseinilytica TaxID=1849581 RepID=A0ABX7GP59_9GAMM|nr:hypothetical protein [Dyella caseinilytica]QRN52094.1 hypothetical protein ISN74_11335 [Dyella caseinilytica]
MKSFGLIAVLAAAFMAAPGVYAQSAAPAAGSSTTVTCNDGTTQTVATTKGACRGHKGINKSASGSTGSSATSNTSASSAAAAAPAAAAASGKTAAASKSAPAATPAAGGGPGQVWVNTASKTKAYHCQGSKWYGTTKQGKYMSTSDAQAAGYHAAKGEKCS